jgi:outer membrane protein W
MAYKRPFVPTKNNWASHQVPMILNVNYYIFNERIKPYVGLGIGTIWGRYDYSLSSEESTEEYYLRDFEGQNGWRFGLTPKVGLMISMDHKHGFGLEFSLPYQFGFNRLETQYTINLGLNYTYIID